MGVQKVEYDVRTEGRFGDRHNSGFVHAAYGGKEKFNIIHTQF